MFLLGHVVFTNLNGILFLPGAADERPICFDVHEMRLQAGAQVLLSYAGSEPQIASLVAAIGAKHNAL